MKLNPQQAPLYGECVLTVQLSDDDVSRAGGEEPEDEVADELEFYLLFSGSTQRHVTSTVRVSRVSLQAVCPAHNICEQVSVTLCWARLDGPVDTQSQSQETFCFVQDLAHDMAHFLLDNTAPQEALLLDDKQIPLKECKRLDESLALALKHLSLPHHRTAHSFPQSVVERQTNHQTHPIAPADAQRHRDINGCHSKSPGESFLIDGGSAVSHGQRLFSLLHLAASHGLWMVASFLLQQDGGREALRMTNARGQTAADVAESRGHTQLLELFRQHEASEDSHQEQKEQLNLFTDGKVFRHHAKLGTYTLTFLSQPQWDGGGESTSNRGCCIQENVEELRRQIQIHRDSKGKSKSAGTGEVSPTSDLWLCWNDQQESTQEAGSSVATTTTDEQGSPLSLEDTVQREDQAVVTHTSCMSGRLCHSQETRGSQSGTPAVKPPAAQNRKNRKRNTKTARGLTESTGNKGKNSTPKAAGRTALTKTNTTGSEEKEGPVSSRDSAEAFAMMVDSEATKSQQRLNAEQTPFPISEVGEYLDRQVVARPKTTVTEKQETEEWEVEVLIDGRATESVTESSQARHFSLPEDPAAHATDMGQEHSQGSRETQTDLEEPNKTVSTERTRCRFPVTEEQKNQRLLWQDEVWIENQKEPERLSKTVWFHSGNLDQGADEDSKRMDLIPRSVWYDTDKIVEEKHEQMEEAKCDMNALQASDRTPPRLLEHGCSSCQLSATLSQPHAVGAKPAPSHGPAAQRREVHIPQPVEEVGTDWKYEGAEGSREEVCNKGSTYSRKSSEASDAERGGEKPKSEEKGAKSRKKRRQKKGKRGGNKPKLSSNVELNDQSETQREEVTGLIFQLESEAKDQIQRTHARSSTVPKPFSKDDLVKDLMQLSRKTEDIRDTAGPVCNLPFSESSLTSPTGLGITDLAGARSSQTLKGKDSSEDTDICGNLDSATIASGHDKMDTTILDGEDATTMQLTERVALDSKQLESNMAIGPAQRTVASGESGEEVIFAVKASLNQISLLYPKELLPGPNESTQDICLAEAPEQSLQEEKNDAYVEPKILSLQSEIAVDDLQIQTQEGRTGTTVEEYLMPCLACEIESDQQRKDENRCAVLLSEEEEGKDVIWNRENEERNGGIVQESLKLVEHKDFCCLGVEEKVNCEENLVATAVAVVTVAISSAIVSLELTQQSVNKEEDNELTLAQEADLQQTDDQVGTSRSTLLMNQKVSAVMLEGKLSDELCFVKLDNESKIEKLYDNSQTDVKLLALTDTAVLQQCCIKTHKEIEIIAQNELFIHSQLTEESSEVNINSIRQANETIPVDVTHQCHCESETLMGVSCPVTDTGQNPKDDDQDKLTAQKESAWQLLISPLEEKESQDRDGSLNRGCAVEGDQRGEQTLHLFEMTEGNTSCCKAAPDVPPNFLIEQHESHPQLLNAPCKEGSSTSTDSVTSCGSHSVTDSILGTVTVPVYLETGDFQGTDCTKDNGSVVLDDEDGMSDKDSVDTLDGCTQREGETDEETVTVENTSDSEAASFSTLHEVCDQTGSESASSNTPQPDTPTCVGPEGQEVCISTQGAPNSSEGVWSVDTPDAVAPQSSRLSWQSEGEDQGSPIQMGGGEDEEGKDQLLENPVCSAILRASAQSMSPFRRHSWEPSINDALEDVPQCSSFDHMSEEMKQTNPHFEQRSISEEDPGPLQSDTDDKGGPKIRRTFSYFRSKMSKKGKDKKKDRRGEKEQEKKEREKKGATGASLTSVGPLLSSACQHCTKPLNTKDTFLCNNCGLHVHKCCKENMSVCPKSKTKVNQPQAQAPEIAPSPAVGLRSKSASSVPSPPPSSTSSSSWEHWTTVTSPDDQNPLMFPRRNPSIFNPYSNLSKSISTSNIAGLDDVTLIGLKFLSQSSDSLHPGNKVNASVESLPDEDTEMLDNQLMEEFECDIKDLEADSWSSTMDKKFLKTLKKDEIKKQDVIYELYQTEFHHVRTLKIMSEVYYVGLQREVLLETDALEKMFPVLDDLLHIHSEFLIQLLEAKRSSSSPGQKCASYFICRIGEVLVNQFSDCSAERMKKAYGKFCSRHHDAVNLYKELHAKDKRFQAFIKKTMSSSVVRRLSIPECILLVTQRITKYPVLMQRILQHTKDSDEDYSSICESLRSVKELITAVDSKVNEQEKKRRLRGIYSRTDSKSIMTMKSGQMFAKEDLIRGRKLLHDGAVQLKNAAGRLKDVHAMLLSDVLVFLQEKDQKYVFASLDQRSTVISLQNLIVREVANEERGLFVITAGTDRPEMVEVLASSKEERNIWMAILQDAMHSMEKEDDEGVPSETEEDRKQQESRSKEKRELLQRKDEQIISLLEEKVLIFRQLGNCNPTLGETNQRIRDQVFFRTSPHHVTKGEPILTDALRELERLHALVGTGASGIGCSVPSGLTGGGVGPVSLPRRAETFGGFDCHQMNISKSGDKEEGDELLDLRRTESDSVLKKGATASLQRNNVVQDSVTHLFNLLMALQDAVVHQDSCIENQRQALDDWHNTMSSALSSSSSLVASSSSSSCSPSSLAEQGKHRSLEIQRQEAANLQKQQASYQEEKRRKEKEWELKEKCLVERENKLREVEEETQRKHRELLEDRDTLQRRREEYQRELAWLKEAQKRLERDEEALRRDTERLDAMQRNKLEMCPRVQRTSSTNSEDSSRYHSSGSLDLDLKDTSDEPKEVELSSSAPTKEPFLRLGSKRMRKSFNPFSSSSSSKTQGAEKSRESQLSTKLMQLTKPKEKKDKKKKGKGEEPTQTETKVTGTSDTQKDEDIIFC